MNFHWTNPYPTLRSPLFARNVVATSQPLAAQAGLQMLRQGGNAVDAAVATAAAMTIVEPCSNGLGSDNFAILWDGQQLHGLNSSGTAPAAWTRDYFLRKHGDRFPMRGWDSVTVPGAVAGWVALSERFGNLPGGERVAGPQESGGLARQEAGQRGFWRWRDGRWAPSGRGVAGLGGVLGGHRARVGELGGVDPWACAACVGPARGLGCCRGARRGCCSVAGRARRWRERVGAGRLASRGQFRRLTTWWVNVRLTRAGGPAVRFWSGRRRSRSVAKVRRRNGERRGRGRRGVVQAHRDSA